MGYLLGWFGQTGSDTANLDYLYSGQTDFGTVPNRWIEIPATEFLLDRMLGLGCFLAKRSKLERLQLPVR